MRSQCKNYSKGGHKTAICKIKPKSRRFWLGHFSYNLVNIAFDTNSCHVFCYLSRTRYHTPSCNPDNVQPISYTQLNDTFCSPSQMSETNNLISNWICSGIYQESIENHCRREGKWIAKFNPCLPIMAISIQVENMTVSALCDTGASKSLISSHLFNTLFSCNLTLISPIKSNWLM